MLDGIQNQEAKELQQALKDNLCEFIQRNDVLLTQVDFEDLSGGGFPYSISIKCKEGVIE